MNLRSLRWTKQCAAAALIDDQADDVRKPSISVDDFGWRAMMALPVTPDNRPELGESVIARNCAEAVACIEDRGVPSFVSFDYDLGDGKDSMWLVKHMVEHDLDHGSIPEDFWFEVHSANPLGRTNIKGLLEPYLAQRATGSHSV